MEFGQKQKDILELNANTYFMSVAVKGCREMGWRLEEVGGSMVEFLRWNKVQYDNRVVVMIPEMDKFDFPGD